MYDSLILYKLEMFICYITGIMHMCTFNFKSYETQSRLLNTLLEVSKY